MADLIERLRAHLDEDERVALGCRGEGWELGNEGAIFGAGSADLIVYGGSYATNTSVDVPAHIARHDPARTLRWVAAARQILDAHGVVVLHAGSGAAYYETALVCRSCETPRGRAPGEDVWPCATVLALASIYGEEPTTGGTT